MTRLLLFLLITLAIYQNGTFGNLFDGNQASTGLEELPDADYPDSQIQDKRNSYQVLQNADASNWPKPANLCYFVQESKRESQISCRLRFTRSKFNFNPFGLRFGKREHSNPIAKSVPITASMLLPYLLKLKESQGPLCGEEASENC